MENKKALSTVVTTLIILLLVLVSVGIFWGVSGGIINKTASQADLNNKCISANIQATKLTCAGVAPFTCDVTFARATGQGSDPVEGVKLIFTTATTRSNIVPVSGDVPQLTGKVITGQTTGLTAQATGVEVTVYFKDSTGKDFICPQTRTFSA